MTASDPHSCDVGATVVSTTEYRVLADTYITMRWFLPQLLYAVRPMYTMSALQSANAAIAVTTPASLPCVMSALTPQHSPVKCVVMNILQH
jgi:hypothetical protein